MSRTPERLFGDVEDSIEAELAGAGIHPVDDVSENDTHAQLPGADPYRDTDVSDTVTKAG